MLTTAETIKTKTLPERFQQGEETALVEMYAEYSGPMFAAAFSRLGDRDLAAEAVQLAFFQAWRAAADFDPSRALQPWLYAITRRTAVDVYRSKRRVTDELPLDAVPDRRASVEDLPMEHVWLVWEVRRAVDALRPDERDVLRLAYYEGMTQTEISRALDVPLGTVKSRTARALRQITQLLSHLEEADPA
ncbi:sigma-70 family RNA polymerase sigma factor [Streptomyces sp. NPDC005500]|uniref:RNA polymerase sigma factor n=1 Tax=Streptomyces sp. NPDC005500 TaxID=3155007 RepID=UPI0033BCFA99